MVDGNVLPSSFSGSKLADPQIWDMLGKIEVVADTEIDGLFPETKRAIVSITTKDSQIVSEQVDHAKGSPENPMSDEEVIAKFKANSEGIVNQSRQEEIIDATWKLGEEEMLIEEFMELLT